MSFSDVVWSLVGIGAVAVAGLLAWDYYQKQVTTQQQQQASQPFRSWICQVTGLGCPSGDGSSDSNYPIPSTEAGWQIVNTAAAASLSTGSYAPAPSDSIFTPGETGYGVLI